MPKTRIKVRQECPDCMETKEGPMPPLGIVWECLTCGDTGWVESWISPGEFARIFEYETGQRIRTEVVR